MKLFYPVLRYALIPLALTFICSQYNTAQSQINVINVRNTTELLNCFKYTGSDIPFVGGHRGEIIEGYPENSIATFKNTFRYTPGFFTIDPRLTKDSTIVLIHDDTLDRATNGIGNVSDDAWAELQKLRLEDQAGSITDYSSPALDEVVKWRKSKTILGLNKKDKTVKIILDSDIGQDCDDAAVMALMHKFADNGEVEILATMFPMQDPMGAPAMDVINTYYGRPDIPIGTYKGAYQYIGKLYDHYNSKLADKFPHDLKHGTDAPDAIALYRKILAKQPNKSVVIVAVGPERLLADLLKTAPDTYSTLSGRDLVKQKVKLLSIMGAGFPKDHEWNIKIAPDAAQLVAQMWPTPIVYSGNEIGKAVRTGSRLLTETPESNPIRASYENHPFVDKVTKDRQSWDQTAMLYAIRGTLDVWTLESNGYNFIDDTGKNEWRRDTDKEHSYLILKKPAAEVQKIIEDLMVAPPALLKR